MKTLGSCAVESRSTIYVSDLISSATGTLGSHWVRSRCEARKTFRWRGHGKRCPSADGAAAADPCPETKTAKKKTGPFRCSGSAGPSGAKGRSAPSGSTVNLPVRGNRASQRSPTAPYMGTIRFFVQVGFSERALIACRRPAPILASFSSPSSIGSLGLEQRRGFLSHLGTSSHYPAETVIAQVMAVCVEDAGGHRCQCGLLVFQRPYVGLIALCKVAKRGS